MRESFSGILASIVICALTNPVFAAEQADAGAVGYRAIFILVIVVAGLFVLAWALKKYGPTARVKRSLGLDVLGQVALNAKANLALIQVGKSVVLIGVTQNNISVIKELEQSEFDKAIDEFGAAMGAGK
ncbi:MAG: flagellar biosynthetic protein FliO [Deltaproteobacteria bacterium]|nr:flagellar biosynthetic protein FliO [Deltaproteobacteria bacterium]